MTPEQRLAAARTELELYYDTRVSGDAAIAALHRLKDILGVELKRCPGVPETMTVTVDYQVELAK